jgi:hypothetical protein
MTNTLKNKRVNALLRILLFGVVLAVNLSGQSLTWGNTSNVAITPQLVVGDYWTLNITGAAPSAAVVLQYTENGGPVSYFTLGYTNGSGNYFESEQETNASVGVWTANWFVGGTQLGSEYDFEVARWPDHLEAVASTIGGSTCPEPLTYGVIASFDFQSKDSTGADVVTHNAQVQMHLIEYWEGYSGYELTQYGYAGIYEYTPIGACG